MSCCSTYLVSFRRYATCVWSIAFVRRSIPRPGKVVRICTFVDGCCCHVARCMFLVCSRRYATRVCSVAFVRPRVPRPGKAARICTFVDGCCCHVARCMFLVCSRRYATRVSSVSFVRHLCYCNTFSASCKNQNITLTKQGPTASLEWTSFVSIQEPEKTLQEHQ